MKGFNHSPNGSQPLLPFQAHSATSRQAAEDAKPGAATERRKVLLYLQSRGEDGATDEECQLALSMNPSTQRPRRVELVRSGLVKDSGRKRRTASGREAVVWTVATVEV